MRVPRLSAVSLGTLAATFSLALAAAAQQTRPNLLLIVIDDVGVETIGAYNQNPQLPEAAQTSPPPPEHRVTPTIDELAQRGLLFRNAWSTPFCKPTRNTLVSGQYGFRTGGNLDPSAVATLPDRLPAEYVDREAIGKWHLSNYVTTNPPSYDALDRPPTEWGFTRYQGFWEAAVGGLYSYQSFDWAEDPPPDPPVIPRDTVNYLTTREIETAIDFVQQERDASEPWFLWLALHALHDGWSECDTPRPPGLSCEPQYPDYTCPAAPPGAACPSPPPASACDEIVGEFDEIPGEFWSEATGRRARCRMLEMMDYEIGRLLAAIDEIPGELETTTVVLLGDNGTPLDWLQQIPGKVNRGAKGDIYEGGINVPLIVAGAGVTTDPALNPPDRIDEKRALVHTVDVLPTLLDLAGAPPGDAIDGVSFKPVLDSGAQDVRSCVYADGDLAGARLPANHDVAVRDHTYKLIRRKKDANGVHAYEFYDLGADPGEQSPLAPSGSAFDALKAQLDQLDANGNASPCKPSPPPPPPRTGGCGVGPELVPALLLLSALRRRRRASG